MLVALWLEDNLRRAYYGLGLNVSVEKFRGKKWTKGGIYFFQIKMDPEFCTGLQILIILHERNLNESTLRTLKLVKQMNKKPGIKMS